MIVKQIVHCKILFDLPWHKNKWVKDDINVETPIINHASVAREKIA